MTLRNSTGNLYLGRAKPWSTPHSCPPAPAWRIAKAGDGYGLTLINIECIDEIAAYGGVKEQVASITEAAMRGEIKDFAESLIAVGGIFTRIVHRCPAGSL